MTHRTPRRSRMTVAAATLVTLIALAGCTAPAPDAAPAPSVTPRTLTGTVAPLAEGVDAADWTVTAYNTGPDGARDIGTATSDATGGFTLSIDETDVQGIVWVDARPAEGTRALLGAIASPEASDITLNERTTVAAGYGLAQFFGEGVPTGRKLWVDNAAAMAANLADPATGELSAVLTSAPNGAETSTQATFGSLTAMLSACLEEAEECDTLFTAAGRDRDRLVSAGAAFAAIARDPSAAAKKLFALSQAGTATDTVLDEAPGAWTLALRFEGGAGMSGPGEIAVDPKGHMWVANASQSDASVSAGCTVERAFEFGPDGKLLSTVIGDRAVGSGYGIAFDRTGRLWLSDVADPDACASQESVRDGVSLYREGSPATPPAGVGRVPLDDPQGIERDGDGNMWVASCGDDSVVIYPRTDAGQGNKSDSKSPKRVTGLGIRSPFALVDNGRHVFVTGNGNSTVAVLDRDGKPIDGSPLRTGFDRPMGIAADSDGNVWVANAGGAGLPCAGGTPDTLPGGSLTLVSADGKTVSKPFTGGGLAAPWGITVDGDGNVWVANSGGQRISEFCGTTDTTCPRGLTTGEPISPAGTGYAFDGLTRSTGIAVDLAGTVWVSNTALSADASTPDAGGHQLVAFVGAAAPVYVAPFE